MIQYLVYALFGVLAALVAFVLIDSAVRFVHAKRAVRAAVKRELEKMKHDR